MEQEASFPVVDVRGVRAVARRSAQDPSSLEVELPGGERLTIARARVHASWDGSHTFEDAFADSVEHVAGGQVVLPVVAEQVEIKKRSFERERLRLTTSVTQHRESVDVPTVHEELSIERVPVGRVVEQAVAPRQDGDTFIVPVYEEKVVLVKQLILKEELHVKRTRHEHHETQEVTLRREQVTVEPGQPDDT